MCIIAHYTFYTICMFMFPVQGHYQTKTNKQKKSHGGRYSKLTERLQTHPETFVSICAKKKKKKNAKVDKNHSETKTQLNTWRVDWAAGLSGCHSECATIGWSGWILQYKLITTLNFCSPWPSSLGQALPPFVALGPLWQCTDSLRCINPSDTG